MGAIDATLADMDLHTDDPGTRLLTFRGTFYTIMASKFGVHRCRSGVAPPSAHLSSQAPNAGRLDSMKAIAVTELTQGEEGRPIGKSDP